ncbi:MAG: hypothetical protein OEQ39_19460 [Gammaproteobacteria bacterium]|nr:hypothetical protein [Gammaproteobacteria bacterium]MDH3469346.1 hypothetical protein [Gammaproteobacteria bacterium]
MHQEDGFPQINIDVNDRAEQNVLFEKMVANTARHRELTPNP